MFKENDLVEINYNGITGTGRIRGIAVGELPIVGKHYIVAINADVNITVEDYPYSCISVPECGLNVVDK